MGEPRTVATSAGRTHLTTPRCRDHDSPLTRHSWCLEPSSLPAQHSLTALRIRTSRSFPFLVLIMEGPPSSDAPTQWLKTVVQPSQECAGSHHTCPHLLAPPPGTRAAAAEGPAPAHTRCLLVRHPSLPAPRPSSTRPHNSEEPRPLRLTPPRTRAPQSDSRPPACDCQEGTALSTAPPLLFLWPPRLPPLLDGGTPQPMRPTFLGRRSAKLCSPPKPPGRVCPTLNLP